MSFHPVRPFNMARFVVRWKANAFNAYEIPDNRESDQMSGFNIRNFAHFVSQKKAQEAEIEAERIKAEFSRKLETFVSNFDAFEVMFKAKKLKP